MINEQLELSRREKVKIWLIFVSKKVLRWRNSRFFVKFVRNASGLVLDNLVSHPWKKISDDATTVMKPIVHQKLLSAWGDGSSASAFNAANAASAADAASAVNASNSASAADAANAASAASAGNAVNGADATTAVNAADAAAAASAANAATAAWAAHDM